MDNAFFIFHFQSVCCLLLFEIPVCISVFRQGWTEKLLLNERNPVK